MTKYLMRKKFIVSYFEAVFGQEWDPMTAS